MTRRDALRAPSRGHVLAPLPGGPDNEFVGGTWNEAAPAVLDFDDESASRELHAREPEDDFATLDEPGTLRPELDAADLADRFERDADPVGPGTWDDASEGASDGVPRRPR